MKNQKFQCKQCGKCCTEFRLLPLFEWETKELKKIAKEKKIKISIKPNLYFLDKKSNTVFVYLYGMFNHPCPFLKRKRCSIYDKRPLICRQFPIFKTPQFNREKNFDAKCFLHCGNFNFKKSLLDNLSFNDIILEKSIAYLKKIYGECYAYALQSNTASGVIGNMINELEKNGKIKIELCRFDIKEHKVISFFDFLVKSGYMKKDSKREIIDNLRNWKF